jgi:cell division protein FtsI (penicillin-binding protein 3)
VLQAFEASSNVGMAKLTYGAYKDNPSQFVNHIKELGLGDYTGIDIVGERHPFISTPGTKYWSATTLPWMAFGYANLISPLGIAMLYNAIANNGEMLKPYLVTDIMNGGVVVKHFSPVVTRTVADSQVVRLLQQCLYGVCNDPHGTGYTLMKDLSFKVCGKTGTALVANGSRGYADRIYQSAFAGYFPAENPQYTCVVEIVNAPRSALYYGAAVAGPVFKEIAMRLYNVYVRDANQNNLNAITDSLRTIKTAYNYTGAIKDLEIFANGLGIKYSGDITSNTLWASLSGDSSATDKITPAPVLSLNQMPNLTGMNLKDALYMCESLGLRVNVSGVGRVFQQSLAVGAPIAKGQLVNISLTD